VVCPSEGKKLALGKAVERHFDGITPVRIEVIEELQPLLARRLGERSGYVRRPWPGHEGGR
jgi:hypothetical protein